MTERHPHLHMPDKRQSISPTRGVWLGLAALAVVLVVIWLVVATAVQGGGDDCAAKANQSSDQCR